MWRAVASSPYRALPRSLCRALWAAIATTATAWEQAVAGAAAGVMILGGALVAPYLRTALRHTRQPMRYAPRLRSRLCLSAWLWLRAGLLPILTRGRSTNGPSAEEGFAAGPKRRGGSKRHPVAALELEHFPRAPPRQRRDGAAEPSMIERAHTAHLGARVRSGCACPVRSRVRILEADAQHCRPSRPLSRRSASGSPSASGPDQR